jgi:putative CocE/NonD family hydrolase
VVSANAGPRDQSPLDTRADVLTYLTEPLEEDLEVIGPVTLVLYVSSSAVDTDFTGKLVDVGPDGRSTILTDGILRARYRNSMFDPVLLQPGEVYELHIDLVATANVFRRGHRIRLDVSSSNSPRFDRNPNTGSNGQARETQALVVATNRVHHDSACPSHLVLPIINRS